MALPANASETDNNDPALRAALTDASASADTTPPPAEADFNPQAWSELLRLFGLSGVDELLEALQLDLPAQQRRYAAALEPPDADALRRIAHALHGVSLQLGAAALAESCTRMESAARAGAAVQALELGREVMARYAALVGRLLREAGTYRA